MKAVFTIVCVILVIFGINTYKDNQRICTNVSIPFITQTIYDNTQFQGSSSIKNIGSSGTRSVCEDGNGNQITSTVTVEPVNRIVSIGTLQRPTIRTTQPSYSTGSICNDGWHSPSTGRGTCSHHGGVAY